MLIWLRDTAVSLVLESGHPILQPLSYLLFGVNGLALELLPPIHTPCTARGASLQETPYAKFCRMLAGRSFKVSETQRWSMQKYYSMYFCIFGSNPVLSSTRLQTGTLGWISSILSHLEQQSSAACTPQHFCSQKRPGEAFRSLRSLPRVPRSLEEVPFVMSSPSLKITSYRFTETSTNPTPFYGVHQSTSLGSVLERLDYEKDGFNSFAVSWC